MANVKFIAEIGWNFLGDMGLADKMIRAAAESGADIIKFQYWQEGALKEGAWDLDGRREIYKSSQLDMPKLEKLMEAVGRERCEFLLSVFSVPDARFLVDKLRINSIKIPSHEASNAELLAFCMHSVDDLYLSLGALSDQELFNTLDHVEKFYAANPSRRCHLMHCVSSYPLELARTRLGKLVFLKSRFADYTNLDVGMSCHTDGIETALCSIPLQLSVIEKHFTVDRTLPGRDNHYALTPDLFLEMVSASRALEESLEDRYLGVSPEETDIVANYRGRWG